MAIIELINQKKNSPIKKVLIHITQTQHQAHLYCADDFSDHYEEILPTAHFLKHYRAVFEHPLLEEEQAAFDGAHYVFQYQGVADLKKMMSVIYATLICQAPHCTMLKIMSNPMRRRAHASSHIPYSISYKKLPTGYLEAERFEKLVKIIQEIPDYEYCSEFLFNVTFSINHLAPFVKDKTLSQKTVDLDRVEHPIHIRYMGDRIGFGGFSDQEIPKGTIVTFYAGALMPEDPERYSLYQFSLNQLLPNFLIDAHSTGNLSRFINHASNRETTTHPFARPNLEIEYENYYGFPIICLKANRTIQKGEQLTYDYGDEYWKYFSPMNFNHQAQLVNRRGKILRRALMISRKTLRQMAQCGLPEASQKLFFNLTSVFLLFMVFFYGLNWFTARG